MRNIVLIGFMGTGKTSVGLALSRRLGMPVYDADALIEIREQRKISQIFEERGEDYFRFLENKTIEEMAVETGAILTMGGGAVMNPDNLRRLKENGLIVCLEASMDTIMKRVGKSKNRPLFNRSADPQKTLTDLLNKRLPQYEAAADMKIPTDGQSPEDVAETIEKRLREVNFFGAAA